MLEICFGTYLLLGLPAVLVLWTALAASKMHNMGGENDQQRYYQIALATSSTQDPRAK